MKGKAYAWPCRRSTKPRGLEGLLVRPSGGPSARRSRGQVRFPWRDWLLIVLATGWLRSCPHAQSAEPPPPRPFQVLVQQHLDSYIRDNRIAGAVVGVAYHGSYYPFTAGVRDRDTRAPLTGETLFPVGSITKIFTGIMIGYLVNDGTITLQEPIVGYLPDEVGRLGGAIRQVTWLDLATHTSGITDPAPGNPAEQVYFDLPPLQGLIDDWIRWRPTPPKPGDPYLYYYANKGFLTLAFAVADAGHRGGYNPLFHEVFRQPLHLRYLQTLGTMDAEMRALLTTAYGDGQNPEDQVGNGVNANLIDLEPFLQACLLNAGTPQRLKDAIEFSQRPFRSKLLGNPNRWMGLGWDLQLEPPYTVAKGGATAGAFSHLKLRPQENLGVMMMANGKPDSGNDIGRVASEILELVALNGDRELARGRPTSHSAGTGPSRPNDGNKTGATFWAAQGPEDWWQVDLGGIQSVGYLHVIPVWNETTSPGYTVSTSWNGLDWTVAMDTSRLSSRATIAGDGHVITPRFARYVRVQSAGTPLKLVELEVFEHRERAAAAADFARPTVDIIRGADGQLSGLRYSYRRLKTETHLTYSILASEDLQNWKPITKPWGTPTVTSDPAGLSEMVSWQADLEDGSGMSGRFLRLVIATP